MHDRSLQRVRDGSHQLPSAVARQLRVRVESDHIFYSAQLALVTRDRGKPIVSSQQQIVQVQKLAAFSLPAHPYFFAGVETAIAVKQKECAFPLGRIPAIQLLDQQRAFWSQFITFIKLCGRVRWISEQCKMKI